jgi:hypothetical protein
MNVLEKKLQLQSLTNTELLTCCFTPTGQLVVDSTHHLNRQPTIREKAHLRAAFYWLKHYQPNSPSQLDTVKGYLEAAHHLGQLEVWDLVCQILFVSISSDRLPLHEQLGTWGLYPEQIDLCEPLVGKVNHELNYGDDTARDRNCDRFLIKSGVVRLEKLLFAPLWEHRQLKLAKQFVLQNSDR